MLVDGVLPEGRVAYLWLRRPIAAAKSVKMPGSPDGYAAVLYSTLHELDREGWDVIAVERPPAEVEWAGIFDRLTRASK